MPPEGPSVIALAGRRIDAPDANPPRFPLERVDIVRDELRRLFVDRGAAALVASAACGADLIALQLAEELDLRARVVLPFAPERFRESSVVDRPGDWGPVFDSALARAAATQDLLVLNHPGSASEGYAAVSDAILDEALRLSRESGATPLAVVVWDGRSRGPGDLTEAFSRRARDLGIAVEFVPTVGKD